MCHDREASGGIHNSPHICGELIRDDMYKCYNAAALHHDLRVGGKSGTSFIDKSHIPSPHHEWVSGLR